MLHELVKLHTEDHITKDHFPFVATDPLLFLPIKYNAETGDDISNYNTLQTVIGHKVSCTLSKEKYEELKPCFLYQSKEIIEKMLSNTTQYNKNILAGLYIYQTMKSPF